MLHWNVLPDRTEVQLYHFHLLVSHLRGNLCYKHSFYFLKNNSHQIFCSLHNVNFINIYTGPTHCLQHSLTTAQCLLDRPVSFLPSITASVYTLRLHHNAVVGVHGGKITWPLFKFIKIVNVTSLPGFHIHKQMPHPPSFGMGH